MLPETRTQSEPVGETLGEGLKEALGYGSIAKRDFTSRWYSGLGLMIIGVFSIGGAWLLSLDQRLVSPLTGDGYIGMQVVAQAMAEPTPVRTTDHYPPNAYFPRNLQPVLNDQPDDVSAIAYAVMDRDTGELLMAKNLTMQRPIASVTKIMTAVVALDATSKDSEFVVTRDAIQKGEAAMGLSPGERMTLDELLYGLLLPSGNDAAETIAESVFLGRNIGDSGQGQVAGAATPSATLVTGQDVEGGDRAAARATFIARMNQKAQTIGMRDTYYVNPTGLDGDTIDNTTQSTALDLLALGRYILDNPTIMDIVGTKSMSINYKSNYHKAFYLANILGLRQSYPGVAGIKPGNTDFAKETLLSYAENGGKRIILVILGSDRTRDDAVKIYDIVFGKFGIIPRKG